MLSNNLTAFGSHPQGEGAITGKSGQFDIIPIETPGGTFHVQLDPHVRVSQFGGLVPFLQFLQSSGLLAAWEEDMPLERSSPNASSKRQLLGTWITAVASGQSRFAHINAVRGDVVIPEVLGCKRLVSEDTIRRMLKEMVGDYLADDPEGLEAQHGRATSWSRQHLLQSVAPLLQDDWILDIDVTIKPLYGFQEGSVVGHNPHKPGRPSHAIHSFLIGRLRLSLDVTVHPGDQHTSATTKGDLLNLLEDLSPDQLPSLIRGDCGFGTEDMMALCENRRLDFLFKQRQTKRTRELVGLVDQGNGWENVGQGWEATESKLELSTWTNSRRAVVLRRLKKQRYPRRSDITKAQQQTILPECEALLADDPVYDYQVLVTSLTDSLDKIAQLYRDRADCENNFDELKNAWGWGGYTTHSLSASQLATRMVAQVYNWWSIYVRILSPEHHREAVTSRPVLLNSIAKRTTSGGQRFLTITSTHRWKERIAKALTAVATYFTQKHPTAEQLDWKQRWEVLLRDIFRRAKATQVT